MYNPLDRIRKVHLAQLKPFYRYEGLPMATDIKFDVEKHIRKYEIPEAELELEPPLGPFQSLENSPRVESDQDFTAEESADEYEPWEDVEMPTNSQKIDTAIQRQPRKSQKIDTAIQKPQNSQKVDTAIQRSRKSQKYDIEPIKTEETRTRSGRRSKSPNRLQFTVITRTSGYSSATEF